MFVIWMYACLESRCFNLSHTACRHHFRDCSRMLSYGNIFGDRLIISVTKSHWNAFQLHWTAANIYTAVTNGQSLPTMVRVVSLISTQERPFPWWSFGILLVSHSRSYCTISHNAALRGSVSAGRKGIDSRFSRPNVLLLFHQSGWKKNRGVKAFQNMQGCIMAFGFIVWSFVSAILAVLVQGTVMWACCFKYSSDWKYQHLHGFPCNLAQVCTKWFTERMKPNDFFPL